MARRHISMEVWEAIRAGYEFGYSARALGRHFDVDHKSITSRAVADGWTRDPHAIDQAVDEGLRRTLEALRGALGEPKPPKDDGRPHRQAGGVKPIPDPPAPRSAVTERARAVEAIKDQLVSEQADMIAVANLAHLERVTSMKVVAAQLGESLVVCTKPARTEDEMALQIMHMRTVLAGEAGSLPAAISAWTRLNDAIQTQERRALGVEERARRVALDVNQRDAAGAPLRTDLPPGLPDFAALPTEDLEKLMDAVLILDGNRARPPVPLPPGAREAG